MLKQIWQTYKSDFLNVLYWSVPLISSPIERGDAMINLGAALYQQQMEF